MVKRFEQNKKEPGNFEKYSKIGTERMGNEYRKS